MYTFLNTPSTQLFVAGMAMSEASSRFYSPIDNQKTFLNFAEKLLFRTMRAAATAFFLSSIFGPSSQSLNNVFGKSLLVAGAAEGVSALLPYLDHPLTKLARTCDTFFKTGPSIESYIQDWEKHFAGSLCGLTLKVAAVMLCDKAIHAGLKG